MFSVIAQLAAACCSFCVVGAERDHIKSMSAGDKCGTQLACQLSGRGNAPGRQLKQGVSEEDAARQVEEEMATIVAANLGYPRDSITVTATRDSPDADWQACSRVLCVAVADAANMLHCMCNGACHRSWWR